MVRVSGSRHCYFNGAVASSGHACIDARCAGGRAYFGTTIGLMFDNKTDPGLPTVVAALAGIVLVGLAFLQLRRCDPWRRFHSS